MGAINGGSSMCGYIRILFYKKIRISFKHPEQGRSITIAMF